MREQTAHDAGDRPTGANPWWEQRGPASPAPPTLSQLGTTYDLRDDDRAARYHDWATRIREQGSRRSSAAAAARQAVSPEGYWSADALFADSRRVEREEAVSRPNPWRVRELLAVLDLRDGATPAEIGTAYRRLAKQHHPDRFVSADQDTQQFHADRMRRIIDAYRTLRELQDA